MMTIETESIIPFPRETTRVAAQTITVEVSRNFWTSLTETCFMDPSRWSIYRKMSQSTQGESFEHLAPQSCEPAWLRIEKCCPVLIEEQVERCGQTRLRQVRMTDSACHKPD